MVEHTKEDLIVVERKKPNRDRTKCMSDSSIYWDLLFSARYSALNDGYEDDIERHQEARVIEMIPLVEELRGKIENQNLKVIQKGKTPSGKTDLKKGPDYELVERCCEFSKHTIEYLYVSQEIKALIEANEGVALWPYIYNLGPNRKQDGKYLDDRIEEWEQFLRSRFESNDFRKKERNTRSHARRRKKSLDDCVNEALYLCSRVQSIRVDLKLSKNKRNTTAYDEFDSCVKRFMNNTRHNSQVWDALLYIFLKIEYTDITGYHAHLLALYDGNRVFNDQHKGEVIGKFWSDRIMDGEGRYFNVNRGEAKRRYARNNGLALNELGIGMIHRNEYERISQLQNLTEYFAKSIQYVRIKKTPKKKHLRKMTGDRLKELRRSKNSLTSKNGGSYDSTIRWT